MGDWMEGTSEPPWLLQAHSKVLSASSCLLLPIAFQSAIVIQKVLLLTSMHAWGNLKILERPASIF